MRRSKCKVLLGWLTLLSAAYAEGPVEESSWRVWLEPKFMRAAVTAEIADAKKTEFAAGFRQGEEFVYLPDAQFRSLGGGWDKLFKVARANADAELVKVEIEYIRDRKKVIEYAVLRSTEPIMATAVLASTFLDRFKDTLGEKFLLAVPNRYTAYAFPKLASKYQDYAPLILKAYRATAYPVSLEVFEVAAGTFRAVGIYEDP